MIVLDGPIGTELARRGIQTKLPLWSASAIESAPEVLAQIHRDYAVAGATVHTANTFRTQQRTVGPRWSQMTARAIEIARAAVPASHRIAGSIAPLEDCYRPDLSPSDCHVEHQQMALMLAECGCDLLLCETFAHVGEASVATEMAVATGLETWVALTAGPSGDLLTPMQLAVAGRRLVDLGAAAVLVNCTPATITLRYVQSLCDANLGVPIGAYANAGTVDEQIGWEAFDDSSAVRYRNLALRWIASGATIVGGCCGTGPAHIEALSKLRAS